MEERFYLAISRGNQNHTRLQSSVLWITGNDSFPLQLCFSLGERWLVFPGKIASLKHCQFLQEAKPKVAWVEKSIHYFRPVKGRKSRHSHSNEYTWKETSYGMKRNWLEWAWMHTTKCQRPNEVLWEWPLRSAWIISQPCAIYLTDKYSWNCLERQLAAQLVNNENRMNLTTGTWWDF